MAGAFKKTMVYLGLADAEDYQDESFGGEQEQRRAAGQHAASHSHATRTRAEQYNVYASEQPTGAVVSLADHEAEHSADAGDGHYQYGNLALDPEYRAPVTPIQRAPSSREESSAMRKITTVHPRSYNDAKLIGEAFREDIPVIMNVTEMGESEAKRLVDFAAGLVFGLGGAIERVTNKVFLLSPRNVEVIAEEQPVEEPATGAKFFNQS